MSASLQSTAGHDIDSGDAAGGLCELNILGNGFFVVRDPASNSSYATQAGHFHLDAQDYLATKNGARLQGRNHGALSALGDLQINLAELCPASNSAPALLGFAIDDLGKITVYLSDGTSFLRGQIMLQNFQEPQALVCEGNQLYSNLSAAGPLPTLAAPGSNGLGTIQMGSLQPAKSGSFDCCPN